MIIKNKKTGKAGEKKDEPTQKKDQDLRTETAGDLGTDRDQQQNCKPTMPGWDPNRPGRTPLRGSAEMPSAGSA